MFIKYATEPDLSSLLARYSGSSQKKKKIKALREWIWLQQDKKCFWCGEEIFLPILRKHKRSNTRASFDHLIPECRDGQFALHNLVVACQVCNGDRSCKDTSETIEWLHFLVGSADAVATSSTS